MAAPLTLDQHLDVCMQQTHLRIGAWGACCDDLYAALQADPEMLTTAQQMVAGSVQLEQRDHITRWRNSLLRQAMES
jgi:hypothetical protein